MCVAVKCIPRSKTAFRKNVSIRLACIHTVSVYCLYQTRKYCFLVSERKEKMREAKELRMIAEYRITREVVVMVTQRFGHTGTKTRKVS